MRSSDDGCFDSVTCPFSAGQIKWTTDSERALTQMAAGSKGALRKLYKKWISYLNKLTAMTRMKLTKIDRNKVVRLHPVCPFTFVEDSDGEETLLQDLMQAISEFV